MKKKYFGLGVWSIFLRVIGVSRRDVLFHIILFRTRGRRGWRYIVIYRMSISCIILVNMCLTCSCLVSQKFRICCVLSEKLGVQMMVIAVVLGAELVVLNFNMR